MLTIQLLSKWLGILTNTNRFQVVHLQGMVLHQGTVLLQPTAPLLLQVTECSLKVLLRLIHHLQEKACQFKVSQCPIMTYLKALLTVNQLHHLNLRNEYQN